jgi:hypothetical protein
MMSANQEQYIPHRLSQFEKASSGIVAAIIIALIVWVGTSVSGQQIQQARIITTQTAQSVTLTKIQSSIDKSVPARNALITSNALLTQRVDSLDREVEALQADMDELEQVIKR